MNLELKLLFILAVDLIEYNAIVNTGRTVFGNMNWGNKLPGSAGLPCCKSLHFSGSQIGEVAKVEELKFNPMRGVVMYVMLGGWYNSFGLPGDDAHEFGDSIFLEPGRLLSDLFDDDDVGSVSW